MWWLFLPLQSSTRLLTSYIRKHYVNGLHLILTSQSSTVFQKKSCVTVSYSRKLTVPVLYQQSLPLISMDLHNLPLRSAAPHSGGLQPPTSDGGRDPGLCSVYMII